MTMTYDLAQAAAKDAGNRSMRTHGRIAWNEDDFVAAVRIFDRLWPAHAASTLGRAGGRANSPAQQAHRKTLHLTSPHSGRTPKERP